VILIEQSVRCVSVCVSVSGDVALLGADLQLRGHNV